MICECCKKKYRPKPEPTHRIMCGDSRDADDMATLMGDDEANVVVTSPPYASQRKYDQSSGFKPIHPDDYGDWFAPIQESIQEHLAEDGSYFLNIKEHCVNGQRSLYVKDLTIQHVREWGWRFIDELCWQRVSIPGLFGPRFKNQWEPVFHFARIAEIKFRPQHVLLDTDLSNAVTCVDDIPSDLVHLDSRYNGSGRGAVTVRSKNFDGAMPGNVIRVSKSGSAGHGARFPVGLAEFFIRAFSDEGDLVLDVFMGSGSTLIAAARAGRRSVGIEISRGYCDVIRRRFGAYAERAGLDPGSGAL